jgi:hypothetical protein
MENSDELLSYVVLTDKKDIECKEESYLPKCIKIGRTLNQSSQFRLKVEGYKLEETRIRYQTKVNCLLLGCQRTTLGNGTRLLLISCLLFSKMSFTYFFTQRTFP